MYNKIFFSFRRTAMNRFTSEEKKQLDLLQADMYSEIRLAAEAHRQVSL